MLELHLSAILRGSPELEDFEHILPLLDRKNGQKIYGKFRVDTYTRNGITKYEIFEMPQRDSQLPGFLDQLLSNVAFISNIFEKKAYNVDGPRFGYEIQTNQNTIVEINKIAHPFCEVQYSTKYIPARHQH